MNGMHYNQSISLHEECWRQRIYFSWHDIKHGAAELAVKSINTGLI